MADEIWTNISSNPMPELTLDDLVRACDAMEPPRKADIRVHPDDRHLLAALLGKVKSTVEPNSVFGPWPGVPIIENEFQARGLATITYWVYRKDKYLGVEMWQVEMWQVEKFAIIDLAEELEV